jgi:positive regulator of sigma E activity
MGGKVAEAAAAAARAAGAQAVASGAPENKASIMEDSSRLLEEIGRVVSAVPGKATVRIRRSKDCEGCHACAMLDEEQGLLAEVEDPLGASPGDQVRILTRGIQGQASAALLLYGLPLAMMLGGAIGAQALFRALGLAAASELPAVGGGLLSLAGAFALVYYARKGKGRQAPRSRIVAILGPSQAGELPQ